MLHHGDCLEILKIYPENHFSGVLTDPPYGLKFMGKSWDHGIPGVEYWKEMLRVCKPGSFLLAFGGTRTFHRLTCAIEDAGWEIRDCLMWLYGSGFPKSYNKFGLEGYGTALKPAWEPIIMAMKPCDGTFAQNVEKWGQGGINIDGCRIEGESWGSRPKIKLTSKGKSGGGFGQTKWEKLEGQNIDKGLGRWPANLILDEEAGAMLDEQSGITKSTGGKSGNSKAYQGGFKEEFYVNMSPGKGDIGGASRFFYCAKASPSERGESNRHPTVKPLKLIEYLLKLIMPPNGTVLDPFVGSGTTCVAAKRLGFYCIGIEKEQEYCEIAKARLESTNNKEPNLFGD